MISKSVKKFPEIVCISGLLGSEFRKRNCSSLDLSKVLKKSIQLLTTSLVTTKEGGNWKWRIPASRALQILAVSAKLPKIFLRGFEVVLMG